MLRMKVLAAALLLVTSACATAPSTTLAGSAAISWTPLVTGSKASLRGLAVVEADTVWASGAGGTVLRSVDGGATWEDVSVAGAETLDFRDVEAFDARTAVVMATAGKIYRTSDAGASWSLVHDDKRDGVFLDALAFSGKWRGLALGDPIGGRFVLLETRDGGGSWKELPFDQRPVALEGESAFAASGTCLDFTDGTIRIVTGGSRARMLSSTNGGATWKAVTLPIVSGNESSGAFGMAVHGQNVVVVGGDYKKPEPEAAGFALSHDRGASWVPRPPVAFRSGAAFAAFGFLLATGTSGSGLSRDAGRTWTPIAGGYNAVACSGVEVCFAVGSEGRIGRLVPR
jgi:photosystem II stability/assembly factor-like uncharacterized protein